MSRDPQKKEEEDREEMRGCCSHIIGWALILIACGWCWWDSVGSKV